MEDRSRPVFAAIDEIAAPVCRCLDPFQPVRGAPTVSFHLPSNRIRFEIVGIATYFATKMKVEESLPPRSLS